jgi:hypothetical protein
MVCLRQDYGPEVHQAAGHEKSDTTYGYIRTARIFIGRVGGPFATLPEESLPRIDHLVANPMKVLRPQGEPYGSELSGFAGTVHLCNSRNCRESRSRWWP